MKYRAHPNLDFSQNKYPPLPPLPPQYQSGYLWLMSCESLKKSHRILLPVAEWNIGVHEKNNLCCRVRRSRTQATTNSRRSWLETIYQVWLTLSAGAGCTTDSSINVLVLEGWRWFANELMCVCVLSFPAYDALSQLNSKFYIEFIKKSDRVLQEVKTMGTIYTRLIIIPIYTPTRVFRHLLTPWERGVFFVLFLV